MRTMQDVLDAEYGMLVGKRVTKIRPLTDGELEDFYWQGRGTGMVIIFDDGSALIPSADEEGNGPGHLFVGSVR